MKRVIAGMAAFLLAAILVFPFKAEAISAEKAIVLDAGTNRVLYQKSADEKSLIASTTKIMTALLICEQCNVLDRMAIPKEAVGIEGSSLYLREGEVLTLQDLLYGLMLHSGNDAAVALAIYCTGTVEGFVGLMNDKAHRLGLENTHFENPHGLDGREHYSTARDLAILTAYAMKNPVFYKTVSTRTIRIGDRALRNHNKLLWHLEGANGVKTGYTKAAGRILVSSVTRQGRQLIAVTINDRNDWEDHKQLHETGFNRFTLIQTVYQDSVIGYAEVAGGTVGYVELTAGADHFYPVAENETVTVVLQQPGFVYAPVVEGEAAGHAYVCIDGKPVEKIPLYYGQTVEMQKNDHRGFLKRLFQKE